MSTFEHAIPTLGTTARAEQAVHGPTPSTRLRAAAARAIGFAVIANVALFALGAPLGLFPQDVLVPGANAPIGLPNVIVDTVLGVGGGAGVLALVRRHAARPQRTFRRIAIGTLLFSYTQPVLVLRGAPSRMLLALDVLHTVAAAIALWTLRGIDAPRSA
jgi:hypothetical protein